MVRFRSLLSQPEASLPVDVNDDCRRAEAVLRQMGYELVQQLGDFCYFRHREYPMVIVMIHMTPHATIQGLAVSLGLQGVELDAFFELLASL